MALGTLPSNPVKGIIEGFSGGYTTTFNPFTDNKSQVHGGGVQVTTGGRGIDTGMVIAIGIAVIGGLYVLNR